MVWSKEDFAREVRRQLVELESLRRKLGDGEDANISLEKLEESQHYILRKLDEVFKAKSPSVPDGVPASFNACLESPDPSTDPAAPVVMPGPCESSHDVTVVVMGLSASGDVAIASDKCPSCGKTLTGSLTLNGMITPDPAAGTSESSHPAADGSPAWPPIHLN